MKTFKLVLILSCILLLCRCSTVFYVSDNVDLKGKRVGIYKFNLVKSKTYEKLPEVSRMEAEAFYPYLIRAGFQVYKLQFEENQSIDDAVRMTDSLKLDYLIVGSGLVSYTGKGVFVHNLTVNFVNTTSLKNDLSGTFEGGGVRVEGVAKRLGKMMIKRINRSGR